MRRHTLLAPFCFFLCSLLLVCFVFFSFKLQLGSFQAESSQTCPLQVLPKKIYLFWASSKHFSCSQERSTFFVFSRFSRSRLFIDVITNSILILFFFSSLHLVDFSKLFRKTTSPRAFFILTRSSSSFLSSAPTPTSFNLHLLLYQTDPECAYNDHEYFSTSLFRLLCHWI